MITLFIFYSYVQQLMPSLYLPNVLVPSQKCMKTICLLDGREKLRYLDRNIFVLPAEPSIFLMQ